MTLLHLKEPLDAYCERRADAHGYIYFLVRETGVHPERTTHIYEARSLATGVVCTFRPVTMEKIEDASEK